MLTREGVLNAWEGFLEEQLSSQKAAIEQAQETARDAPGSNVTRSDQSKFSYSNLALGLEKVKAARENALTAIPRMREGGGKDRVSVGSILAVSINESEALVYYLLAPHAQGDTFTADSETVTAISTESPLGQVLLGQEEESDVEFKGKWFYIVNIL